MSSSSPRQNFETLPTEIFLKILQNLPENNLKTLRLTSKRFKMVIETYFNFCVILTHDFVTENILPLLTTRDTTTHPFNQINFYCEEFSQLTKIQLVTFLEKTRSPKPITLSLFTKCVPSVKILFTFLEEMQSQIFKITLKLEQVTKDPELSFYLSQNLTSSFSNIEKLILNGPLSNDDGVDLILEIFRRSPNLKKFILGDPTRLAIHEFYPFEKLFESKFLKNVQISLAHAEGPWLDEQLLLKLKQKNVTFTQLHFRFTSSNHNQNCVKWCHENLKKITRLVCLPNPAINFGSLLKLKVLEIYCSPRTLFGFLKNGPNLEKLGWTNGLVQRNLDFENEDRNLLPINLSLSKLTRLVLKIEYKVDLEFIQILALFLANVKSLKCRIATNEQIHDIFAYFPNVSELELCIEYGHVLTEHVIGPEPELVTEPDKLSGPGIESRSSSWFIGDLKHLKILKFGLLHWQIKAIHCACWDDVSTAAAKRGLAHLSQLREVSFPPMRLDLAKGILLALTNTKWNEQIDRIEFQVWAGANEGFGGTMRMTDVSKMIEETTTAILNSLIWAVPIQEADDLHISQWT